MHPFSIMRSSYRERAFFMKKIICSLLALCLLISVSGCALKPTQKPMNTADDSVSATPTENNTEGNSTATTPTENNTEGTSQGALKLGDSFEEPTILKSGKLIHTFTSAKIVTSIDGIPDTNCFLSEALVYKNENNEWEVGELPAFVQEDGSFVGAYVLLIDVTTTSEDAVNYTTDDLDADGYPLGEYDDPYLNRVDTLGTLIALNHPENNELNYQSLGYIEYNSLLNYDSTLPDNHYAYHLEPGKTIKYTIGFIIYEEHFAAMGCEIDFSQLYFSTPGQQIWSTLVDLELGK